MRDVASARHHRSRTRDARAAPGAGEVPTHPREGLWELLTRMLDRGEPLTPEVEERLERAGVDVDEVRRRFDRAGPREYGAMATAARRRESTTEGAGMSDAHGNDGRPAGDRIDERIAELGDWRGETLSRVRALIREVDPEIVEGWKWRGTPTWEHDGIVCTGETYAGKVKLTFFRGAALEDPAGLFNSSLDGNARRAIDIAEGERIDVDALGDLLRAAIALNAAARARKPGRS